MIFRKGTLKDKTTDEIVDWVETSILYIEQIRSHFGTVDYDETYCVACPPDRKLLIYSNEDLIEIAKALKIKVTIEPQTSEIVDFNFRASAMYNGFELVTYLREDQLVLYKEAGYEIPCN